MNALRQTPVDIPKEAGFWSSFCRWFLVILRLKEKNHSGALMRFLVLLLAAVPAIIGFAAQAGEVKPIKPITQEENAECRLAPVYVWIKVTNVREDRGFITAQLHDGDPDKWLESKERLNRERWVAQVDTTELCFVLPSPGTYAIAVYHDLNASRKLDTTWIGIPEEPVGASNNPSPGLGPPSHDEVAFEVPDGGTMIEIALYEW